MVNPNWGLLYQGQDNFQNALSQGFQMGDMMRQRREEGERRNALAAYAKDPSEQNFATVAQAAPEFALRERERMDARMAQQQEAGLVQRAIGGDPEAMTQLATVNFDKWKSLSSEQRAATKREAEIFGNAALDVLNRPPEQRQAAVMAYAQQLGQQYPEVAQIAQLPPDQLESALRAAVAEAQMVGKLIELEQPNYRVIPEGGSLVDVGNPQAVQQFAPGASPQGLPQVTAPDEAMRLPPGSQFMLPDGRIGTVPGGPASAPGGFPGN